LTHATRPSSVHVAALGGGSMSREREPNRAVPVVALQNCSWRPLQRLPLLFRPIAQLGFRPRLGPWPGRHLTGSFRLALRRSPTRRCETSHLRAIDEKSPRRRTAPASQTALEQLGFNAAVTINRIPGAARSGRFWLPCIVRSSRCRASGAGLPANQASATRLPNFQSPSAHSASNRAWRSPGRNCAITSGSL
jgi:hypothetical protein